ncbi:MAG TPA: ImmA/IrrE family metallo-endopeptidase [Candidatus Acetothermia bacterium]|nr:ImmA/IrrE family metallo-endopeptidase [Candidatus Acetothermia bacterium]
MSLERIESKAEEVLDALNVKSIPVPVEMIADRMHIVIRRGPSKEFSGLLIRKDDRALIGVNSNEVAVRQRFTIAHELGHFLLHPKKDAFVDYRDNKSDVKRDPKERQANMFAAALLMPRKSLGKDFKSFAKNGFTEMELQMLADKYQVSEDAMRFRLINLNLKP